MCSVILLADSEDCRHFELDAPDFSEAVEVIRDMEEFSQMWSLYEEFQEGFQGCAKEDWITFRWAGQHILFSDA